MAQHMTFLKYPRICLELEDLKKVSLRIIAADIDGPVSPGFVPGHLTFTTINVYVHEQEAMLFGIVPRTPFKTTISVKIDEILSCCKEEPDAAHDPT